MNREKINEWGEEKNRKKRYDGRGDLKKNRENEEQRKEI